MISTRHLLLGVLTATVTAVILSPQLLAAASEADPSLRSKSFAQSALTSANSGSDTDLTKSSSAAADSAIARMLSSGESSSSHSSSSHKKSHSGSKSAGSKSGSKSGSNSGSNSKTGTYTPRKHGRHSATSSNGGEGFCPYAGRPGNSPASIYCGGSCCIDPEYPCCGGAICCKRGGCCSSSNGKPRCC